MNSYERVKAAIGFGRPDRLPVCLPDLGVTDWIHLSFNSGACFRPEVADADEWGCVWGRTHVLNMGQVVGHPFAGGIPRDLGRTASPDFDLDARYVGVAEQLDSAQDRGLYVIAGLFMVLFERVQALTGFEAAMVGTVDPELRPEITRLMGHIVDVQLRYVDNLHRRFGNRIHGIAMSDDFGTQQAAFVSLECWMEFFFPHYQKLFDQMHAAGYDVWVHSCGRINELIDGYIAAGVDVLNLQQPRLLGVEDIGKRFRRRIALETLCDIQRTLPVADPSAILRDAEDLMTHWATPEGGMLLGDYGDSTAIGAIVDGKRAMYDAFSLWSEKIYGQPLPDIST